MVAIPYKKALEIMCMAESSRVSLDARVDILASLYRKTIKEVMRDMLECRKLKY